MRGWGVEQRGQFCGRKLGEVAFEGEREAGEVLAQRGDGLRVEINSRQHAETGTFHAESEAAAAAEKVEAGELA